ncbi:MAG TPA: ABC transporter substrate-binding protein [Anaerolineales bacterium]|nr:ABC transporter substrate-binding protein [Anaerolineales bacterium]
MNTNTYRIVSSSILLILILSACGNSQQTPALTPVTVQLQWTHQVQFAGLYAADQNGYFTEEGLDVTFLEGGAGVDRLSPLMDGKAQFSMATADEIILWRVEGSPVRTVAIIYRRSPILFIALKQTGITKPQDFAGKTIRVTANLVSSLHAMTTRVGILPNQYTEVVLPSDMEMFASGEVPIWGGFTTGFAVSAREAGLEFNTIYPDDYGVHFYADSLFTTDDFIAKNSDLVLRFLRATLKGWTYAVEHPAEVGTMVLKYSPKADINLENEKMTASIPLINTGEDFIGWMKPEIWAGMEQTLREQNVLTAPLDVTQVYTTQFLEEIYGK